MLHHEQRHEPAARELEGIERPAVQGHRHGDARDLAPGRQLHVAGAPGAAAAELGAELAGLQDLVAHLDLRVIPGVGVGYQWSDKPDWKFSTEAGVDWVYERYENDGVNEHFAARAAYHLEKRLNERVTLFHNLEYLPSFHEISDFNMTADAGIRSTLYKNLFSEFKVEWRFDSTPAPGASDSDFRYTLTIGFTF